MSDAALALWTKIDTLAKHVENLQIDDRSIFIMYFCCRCAPTESCTPNQAGELLGTPLNRACRCKIRRHGRPLLPRQSSLIPCICTMKWVNRPHSLVNAKRFPWKMTRRRERFAGIEGAHSLYGSNLFPRRTTVTTNIHIPLPMLVRGNLLFRIHDGVIMSAY